MKNILCLGIFMLQILFVSSQSLYFNFTNGTSSSYDLIDIEKITFDDDLMKLHLLDGSLFSWNVSSIGHYEYDENNVGNVDELLNEINSFNLNIYPNPVGDFLNISYHLAKEEAIELELYDFATRLLIKKNIGAQTMGDHQEQISIGDLPTGSYLLKMNGLEWSITKKIIKK